MGGTNVFDRGSRDLLERAVKALEKIADDPQVEIEAGPAICPNCGKLNPVITIEATEGAGPLEEFVLVAECHNCNHTIYGMVESWSMFENPDSLEAEIEQRRAETNHD